MCKEITVFIIAVCLGLGLKSSAQYQNVWAFGRNAGIDFNSDPPKAIKTGIYTLESSASSICDDNGQLLFYTDGATVWDRNHNVMPDGYNITGIGAWVTYSTSQGALIVPFPGNDSLYYIFSLISSTGMGEGHDGELYYSVVDMSLNNGLGDVYRKGALLDSGLTEHMMAVSGNSCNIWLLLASRSNVFKAYNIDVNGIDPPIVSPRVAGEVLNDGIAGCIDVSPDRSKLAIAQGNLVLYDFDADRGTITNPLILMLDRIVDPYFYGVCFSPDNSKLYVNAGAQLQQFDLALNDTNDIKASQTFVANVLSFIALQRGPDGRVYCAGVHGSFLHVINRPNFAGTACQFVAGGFSLLPGTQSQMGLPNSAIIVTNRKIYRSRTDTVFCLDQFLLTPIDTSGMNYVWNDNSTGKERLVNSSGTYWVSYEVNSPCMLSEYVDTFKIIFDFSLRKIYTTTVDSGMCASDTILMMASNLNGANYTWEDSSKGKQRKINRTGTYWVSYQINSLCENHVDSFIITYPEYSTSFSMDTLVCQNEPVTFQNTSDPHFNNFIWSFGNGDSSLLKDPQYAYTQAGSYDVRLIGKIDSICPDTTFKTIIVDPLLFSHFITTPDSICVGESITFSHEMKDNTIRNLHWQFGDGYETVSFPEHQVQHAYDISGIMPVTMTVHARACPNTYFTDTIYVYALPEVDLGADTGLCFKGTPVILKNLHSSPDPDIIYRYLWNTGDTTTTLKIVQPGTYSLTVSTEPSGCSTTETINVTKDCYMNIPNAFTPDRDGLNDYFFPRKLLSQNVTRFKMQVFNRWGVTVFETTDANGLGWDGRFNGENQPGGVYMYLIEAEFQNGRTEHYQGNITLIR